MPDDFHLSSSHPGPSRGAARGLVREASVAHLRDPGHGLAGRARLRRSASGAISCDDEGRWPSDILVTLVPEEWDPTRKRAQRRTDRVRRRDRLRYRRRRAAKGHEVRPRVRRMPYFRAWLGTLPTGTRVRPSEVARMFGVTTPRARRLFMWALESGALERMPPRSGEPWGRYVVPHREDP